MFDCSEDPPAADGECRPYRRRLRRRGRMGNAARTNDAYGVAGGWGSADPEAVQHPLVASPVTAHADRQFEMNVERRLRRGMGNAARTDDACGVAGGAQLCLDGPPRGGADRLDHPPLAADQDPLLRLRLDEHDRLDAHKIL